MSFKQKMERAQENAAWVGLTGKVNDKLGVGKFRPKFMYQGKMYKKQGASAMIQAVGGAYSKANVGNVVAGTILFGPLGFLGGLAIGRHKTSGAVLVITGKGYQLTIPIAAGSEAGAVAIAANINEFNDKQEGFEE